MFKKSLLYGIDIRETGLPGLMALIEITQSNAQFGWYLAFDTGSLKPKQTVTFGPENPRIAKEIMLPGTELNALELIGFDVLTVKDRGMRLFTRIVTEADSEGRFENPRMARLMLIFSLPLRTKNGRKVI